MSQFTEVLEKARVAGSQKKYVDAESEYYFIINAKFPEDDQKIKAKFLQDQETAIIELGKLYQEQKSGEKLCQLLANSRSVLGVFAKSKTAKIVKTLVEDFDAIPGIVDLQIKAIRESITWAIDNKLSFLRQQLQLRLSSKLYETGAYQEGLKIITDLLREYKKLDDKSSLVEVQLVESQIYHALRNIPKSRAALTSARTSANSIYCPTILQAELDCQSGILNAEDRDYKTSFSYFYESFEGFNAQGDTRAITVLKYVLLSKIMLNLIDDVNVILNNKNVTKYQSRDIDAMKAIATAYSHRSLKEFEDALISYADELKSDPIIKNHFNALYDNLLEQNLLKIIESYSVVELSHISKIIGLNLQQVEGKLSQMILDKVFYGVLDQGNGWLIIYDEPRTDSSYEASLELFKNLSNVVDLLYEKAASLN
ncbi:putative 26S proteasome regulatory subunit [Clavispora lusitaniae]|uniref:26S proteasome regulatory subunit n=1 Tax=Clavispora lusitaniae TaxID=36911 RepID=A0ACD0WN09_CLALS|nr:putative 26S proteasome regulatory subunit [Clavispora lusitaniae]QFZ34284.1 putative 26S proteasome regulatory subunit [Clavispora lusitaniae]QFZ39968.1 putative 26S proteasome regulatory subunit [Clavispora lusitaniae]QFZ45650.1 putative 26S proteasome regulatory subunit [Clavispora lusitaniae]QFZ51314.1 putative 26S proteasome regulatory subunit [Clavispora lusitaniae]